MTASESTAGPAVVRETYLPGLRRISQGKVRDIYDAGDGRLLLVTTDRVSAFDVVLPGGIPDKGRVLNGLSTFWFRKTRGLVENHLITDDVDEFPDSLREHRAVLEGRSMLVRRLAPVPFECVVRGYLYGSGIPEYREKGTLCGISLPPGMERAGKFSEPLFTPATKAETGHDENVSEAYMAERAGAELTARLKEVSIALYETGRDWADERGILIADTKFEFGLDGDGAPVLIDEVLTPDSSRFWPKDRYAPGALQESFDKQFVRDWLETLDWNKEPPGPPLPDEVTRQTADRYRSAYRTITGTDLPPLRYS